MHALLVGATGATGTDLLERLIKDSAFIKVDIFVRRSVDLKHEKLTIHVINFDKPNQWRQLVKGDVLFSCLGTTIKAAGSKKAQWKIDYDYQYEFAKAAKENNVNNYVLVSSDYASARSPLFYARMKGMLEDAVSALKFLRVAIFNPPILIRMNSNRASEVVGLKVIQLLNKIGLFRAQKPLPTTVLAQAMINAAKTNTSGIVKYKGNAIWQRAGVK